MTSQFVLRIRLGPGPPADVEPLTIAFVKDARPFQARNGPYPMRKREFFEKYTMKPHQYGFLKITSIAEWISARLIVPKAPPAYFRLTFYLYSVNATTKPMVWPTPNVDAEISDIKDSKFFASIDFQRLLATSSEVY